MSRYIKTTVQTKPNTLKVEFNQSRVVWASAELGTYNKKEHGKLLLPAKMLARPTTNKY